MKLEIICRDYETIFFRAPAYKRIDQIRVFKEYYKDEDRYMWSTHIYYLNKKGGLDVYSSDTVYSMLSKAIGRVYRDIIKLKLNK